MSVFRVGMDRVRFVSARCYTFMLTSVIDAHLPRKQELNFNCSP